jgi:hypothetical protein
LLALVCAGSDRHKAAACGGSSTGITNSNGKANMPAKTEYDTVDSSSNNNAPHDNDSDSGTSDSDDTKNSNNSNKRKHSKCKHQQYVIPVQARVMHVLITASFISVSAKAQCIDRRRSSFCMRNVLRTNTTLLRSAYLCICMDSDQQLLLHTNVKDMV